jgi:hypothetical protein
MQQQTLTVQIWRPPAPSGGKIGTPTNTGTTATILVEMHPKLDPIMIEADGKQFYNLFAQTLYQPLPDIREQDRLIDTASIDPHTSANPIYIVRGLWTYPYSHLELFLQRQVGA